MQAFCKGEAGKRDESKQKRSTLPGVFFSFIFAGLEYFLFFFFSYTLHILLERVECVISNKTLDDNPGFFCAENLGMLVLGVLVAILPVPQPAV